MTNIPLKTGPWTLKELANWPKHNKTVFSCFHCGGGSSMGYKLAGFDVLGGVEIDPEMMAIYKANHNPRLPYLMGVEEFNKIPDSELPPELFDLDVLDGSPPCSSFSMAGSREDKWGSKTYFREGQKAQVLDDLFFHFIQTAAKLKPRVVVAENVKGLIQGNARGYVKEIFKGFRDIGYQVQLFLLNASRMGVPQARERTFFIAHKTDKKLELCFNELPIDVDTALSGVNEYGRPCTPDQLNWYRKTPQGKSFSFAHPKGSWFNSFKLHPKLPAPTVIGSAGSSASGLYHWEEPRHLHGKEYARLQSFPDDYDPGKSALAYICGMSVPPFMMQRVALEIYKQLLISTPLAVLGRSFPASCTIKMDASKTAIKLT